MRISSACANSLCSLMLSRYFEASLDEAPSVVLLALFLGCADLATYGIRQRLLTRR